MKSNRRYFLLLLVFGLFGSILVLSSCASPTDINSELDRTSTTAPSATIQPPINTTTPTITATFTPTPTPTITPSPTMTPTELGGSEWVVYQNDETIDGKTQQMGINRVNLTTREIISITDPDYILVGMSPDHKNILAIQANAGASPDTYFLYNINLADNTKILLAENYCSFSTTVDQSSTWYSNNKIAYIGWENFNRYIYLINPDGSESIKITNDGKMPLIIQPSSEQLGICWSSGYVTGNSWNIKRKWCTSFDGFDSLEIPTFPLYIFSPQNNQVAYWDDQGRKVFIGDLTDEENLSNLIAVDKEFNNTQEIFWSPDGSKLLVRDTDWYPACESCREYYFLFAADGTQLGEIVLDVGASSDAGIAVPIGWSRDGRQLMFRRETGNNKIWESTYYLYDLESKTTTNLEGLFPKTSGIRSIYW